MRSFAIRGCNGAESSHIGIRFRQPDRAIFSDSCPVPVPSTIPLFARAGNRAAGVLLFALPGVVAVVAVLALALHAHPAPSQLGIGITIAALIAMRILRG